MNQLLKKLKQFQIILSKQPLYIKYSIFIVPISSLFLAIAILLLVTIPQAFKLIENNQMLSELKQKKADYQTKTVALNQVDVLQYKTDLNSVLAILPNEKDIPSAINSILDVISRSGLTLTNFSIGSSGTPVSGVDNFSVNIEVTGSPDQIKNLIKLTNSSSRLIKITSISMNYGIGGAAQTTMDILVFYAPLDTNPKSNNDQPIKLLSSEDQNLLDQIQQNIGSTTLPNNQSIDGVTGKADPFN